MIYHKLARVLGIFVDVQDKFKHAMEIYSIFLQAMENHPSVLSTVGVAQIHSTQYNTSLAASRSTLSALDLLNAEEILLIAVLEIEEIKVYDSAVLQPFNMVMVAMLEHALQYYPESMRIQNKLIKIYTKLGLPSLVNQRAKGITPRPNTDVNTAKKDYQRLSASRFSVASSFGKPGQLEELATDGHTLFSNRLIEYKNTIVNAYHSRDFEKIYPSVQVCEM
jgi:hypothetical protein